MNQKANAKMVTKLMFRLLPIQILLAMVGAVNGIVSSFFASNSGRHAGCVPHADQCQYRRGGQADSDRCHAGYVQEVCSSDVPDFHRDHPLCLSVHRNVFPRSFQTCFHDDDPGLSHPAPLHAFEYHLYAFCLLWAGIR